MMFGFRDVFQYLECGACGCVQLLNPPQDLGRYYPSGYSAFRSVEAPDTVLQHIWENIRDYARERRNQGYFEGAGWLDRLLARRYEYPQLESFARMRASRQVRVLDVGCGSGRLLLDLKKLGYENLLGVDPFIPKAIDYGNGVRVMKEGLENLAGTKWDVIMFHHAFEHMPDPAKVLRFTANLLAPNGHCLIRIPVVARAWEQYGANWVQLDAPRHLFLQTERSFQLLAHREGLRVYKVTYDSNESQFWASELYSRDIPLREVSAREVKSLFGATRMKEYRRRALEMNGQGVGDQAAFYLVGGNEAPADSVASE